MFRRPKELLKAKRGTNRGSEVQQTKTSTSSPNAINTVNGEDGTADESHDGGVQNNLHWLSEVMKLPQDLNCPAPTLLTEDELTNLKDQRAVNEKKIYKHLTQWQTRLLKLIPGDASSPLSCSMVEVNVIDGHGMGVMQSDGSSSIITYDALSYSWGWPASVCSISCNGTPLGLALELATALLYLRSSTTERYIWCDAICINQHDLIEKAQQVKIMLRIFEKADLVVAWLGRPCPSTGRLFEMMKLVSAENCSLQYTQADGVAFEAIEEARRALEVHLRSAWFLRTWCRQEVYASKLLTIQIGPHQLPFETFLRKLPWLELLCNQIGEVDAKISIPETLQVYRRDYQHRGTDRHDIERKEELPSYVQHWVDVLNAGSLFQVTDERDRIYGALGLLTSMSVKFFARLPPKPETLAAAYPIDYKKELSAVYQDVTKFLINKTQTLEILDVFRDRRGMETGTLPGWATDWGRQREEHALFHTVNHARYGFKNVREQDYADVGKLRLSGIRAAARITSVDADKDISHPKDRFKPKYRRPITLQDIMKGLTRRIRTGLASEIHNPPYSFVFTHVEETETTFEMLNVLVSSENLDSTFASWLAGSNYVFAYVEDRAGVESLELGDLHLLVPINVELQDVIVSLYGSRCLHLLRPVFGSVEFRYIGPVAAIACGQEDTVTYSYKGKLGRKSIPKLEGRGNSHNRETFIIV